MSKFDLNDRVYPEGRSHRVGRVVRIQTHANLATDYQVRTGDALHYDIEEDELRSADNLPKLPWKPKSDWHEDDGSAVWMIPIRSDEDLDCEPYFGCPLSSDWPWLTEDVMWIPLPEVAKP